MSENKSSGYLEGNYDGKNMVSLAGQIAADIAESIVISQEAEKEQEKAKEKEAKRILGKESVMEEDIDKILEDYATNEEYKQYLMDGAVLQCNQATLDPFILPDGTKIDLVLNANENGEERKQTNLCVLDKSMSANDTPYATVLDTKQEENIFPFRCHCKRGVDREEEYSKIKNDPSCKTDGVCKHLMKLSKEWDNLPLEGQLYKKRDVTIEIMDDLNLIMKDTQCINMMSMLFCKHGGLITPVTSGQTLAISNGFQFTKEQLIGCGWINVTDEEVSKLNAALSQFGVTSKDSAFVMIATMLSESKCEYAIEGEGSGYNIKNDADWAAYKNDLAKKGMVIKYDWKERGAGYIQITWRKTHLEFLNAIGDSYNGNDTAEYIAKNYPIEASVWYWTNVDKTSEHSLNAYVEQYGASKEIFLITQYFVNGYITGINASLASIRNGSVYSIDIANNKLTVGNNSFRLPNGWADRENYWGKAEKQL